jgi:hypothetical protein
MPVRIVRAILCCAISDIIHSGITGHAIVIAIPLQGLNADPFTQTIRKERTLDMIPFTISDCFSIKVSDP